MSLSVEPDYQDFIVRIADILRRSALLFPRTVGLDVTKTDLVTQIIENELPIPQLPIDGPGPPYIFVAQSETPIISQETRGRDSLDIKGGRRTVLEFYVVALSTSTGRKESLIELFNIISAATTTLGQDRRLTDSSSLNPLAVTIEYKTVPYIYDITQTETVAKNIVVRITTGVNLR